MNDLWIYLSHPIEGDTPTYGNRNKVVIEKSSSISRGDAANETHIATTLHIGTHIDFPSHFYEDGQTIKNYPASFWIFSHPLVVEIEPKSLVIEQELFDVLDTVNPAQAYDILLIRTGFGKYRTTKRYWEANPGFAPSVYDYIRKKLPEIRIMGFDTISVSSFQHRDIGREAHRRFLNPAEPVLLLEDMDLSSITTGNTLLQVIVTPLQISNSDGAPCMVIGKLRTTD